MATYKFTRCVNTSGTLTPEVIASIDSIGSSVTTFKQNHFKDQTIQCWTSFAKTKNTCDYLYTPTGTVSDTDCILVSEKEMWAVCMSSLCGMPPAGSNPSCEFE